MNSSVFTGGIPALMTPCTPTGEPDFEGLVRKGRELINLGMTSVVYCGSMGDWPLLPDDQRQEGVAHLVAEGITISAPNVNGRQRGGVAKVASSLSGKLAS